MKKTTTVKPGSVKSNGSKNSGAVKKSLTTTHLTSGLGGKPKTGQGKGK